MAIPFNVATNAYGQAQRLIDNAARATPEVEKPTAAVPDFGSMVTENINSVVEAGKNSDQMAIDMVNGKANLVDVVTAIAETEVAVESMVTIRDRVIQAYEEIMRMPI